MSEILHEYNDFTKEHGHSLISTGIEGCGFKKATALMAVSILVRNHVPILGGDVFRLVNEQLELTYDNWYIERLPGEMEDSYVARCGKISENYINSYEEPDGSTILYALVVPA